MAQRRVDFFDRAGLGADQQYGTAGLGCNLGDIAPHRTSANHSSMGNSQGRAPTPVDFEDRLPLQQNKTVAWEELERISMAEFQRRILHFCSRLIWSLVPFALFLCESGHAQSLGSILGEAVIGRPLDIVVQSARSANDAADSACVEADVYFGETKVAASAVSVGWVQDGTTGTGGVRIQVDTPLDDAYVRLWLHIGCQARISREYLLLAQPPEWMASARAPTVVASTDQRSAEQQMSTELPAPAVLGSGLAPVAAVLTRPKSTTTCDGVVKRSPARTLRTTARSALAWRLSPASLAAIESARHNAEAAPKIADDKASSVAVSRLRIDPPLADADATNDGAARADDSAGDANEQAESAGEDAAGAATAGASAQLQTLQEENAQLQAAPDAANPALQQQGEFAWDDWMPWLAALAIGGFGTALGMMGWRKRAMARAASTPAGTPRSRFTWTKYPLLHAWLTQRGARTTPATTSAPLDDTDERLNRAIALDTASADASAVAPSGAAREALAEPGGSATSGPPAASAASGQALDVQALFDLWHRVDVFESLGQTTEAILTLQAFVQAHPCASEAPYLRWWSLARQHGLDTHAPQTLYEQHYQQPFMPDDGGPGLEADAALLEALTRAWPSPDARALLTAALASQPNDPTTSLHIRTLAAFDDLIMLHGVIDLLSTVSDTPVLFSSGSATAAASAADARDMALDFDLPDVTDLPPLPSVPDTTDPVMPPAPQIGERDGDWNGDGIGGNRNAGDAAPQR